MDRYGENYKLKASVDQSNSSFYAGEEAQRKVLERTLSIEGVDMMSDIDSSTVREYRIYHVILEIEGTRRSKTAEYDVFLILVNNTWYVVRIYG